MELERLNLRVNMKGDDVKRLQQALHQLHFEIDADELEDHRFGKSTSRAVRAFQKASGIETSGVVDELTAHALNQRLSEAGHLDQDEGYVVSGQIRSRTRVPVPGLLVRAVDMDPSGENWLGEPTFTDQDGRYTIRYCDHEFRIPGRESGNADVVVRVYDPGKPTKPLAQSKMHSNVEREVTIDLTVEREITGQPPPGSEDLFVVKGHVRSPDGKPTAEVRVRAFDARLQIEHPLGQDTTKEDGLYEIAYTGQQLRRPGKPHAALRVRAYDKADQEIALSAIVFNAGQVEQIDLVVGNATYRGPTQLEQLETLLKPLVGDVPFAELREDDVHQPEEGKYQHVTFLSSETDEDPRKIQHLAAAHRLAERTGIDANVFYGWFCKGMPAEFSALSIQDPNMLRETLKTAARENIIPAYDEGQIDDAVDQLRQVLIQEATEPKDPDSPMVHSPIVGLLRLSLPEVGKQRDFLERYLDHKGSMETFWPVLDETGEYDASLPDIQFTFGASALTGGHVPVAKVLFQEYKEPSITQEKPITQTRDLAKLSQADWQRLLDELDGDRWETVLSGVPGETPEEKRENYVKEVMQRVEQAYPTPFVAARLKEHEIAETDQLAAFFESHPDFDLRNMRLETYLATNPSVHVEPKVLHEAKRIQRLYRVAAGYDAMRPLYEDGLESAYDIVEMGVRSFEIQYKEKLGGRERAQHTYARAEKIHATAVALLADHGLADARVSTHAVPDARPEQIASIPDWQTLFGSLGMCECDHCRSVYGPAAYLVDIVHFLEERKLPDPESIERDESGNITSFNYMTHTVNGATVPMTAKDALFQRRPDIGDIELTCQNTNIPVPYIDLVNEILEDYVVAPPGFAPFVLDPACETDLEKRNVSDTLRDAFGPHLTDSATISVKEPHAKWAIDDLALTYTIQKDDNADIRAVARSLQTSGTAAEREANPQYLNTDAYDVLNQQVYPLNLPFNLWAEEGHIYLEHLNVPRYEIMEAFLPGNRLMRLQDHRIARAYLRLTEAEAHLVNGTTGGQPGLATAGVWNLWGFEKQTLDNSSAIPDPEDGTAWIEGGQWLGVLAGRVDVFLQQSGLTYIEMLQLLETYAVNRPLNWQTGTRSITLQAAPGAPEETCETGKLLLAGMDQGAALSAVRFIRLWRKLGWSMYDLDRAILAFRPLDQHPIELDDTFLTQIALCDRLRRQLESPVDRLFSLWIQDGPTENDRRLRFWTVRYTDHEANEQSFYPSLYERLFRNKSAVIPLAPAFPEDPRQLAGTLSGNAASITAALGISSDDLTLLLHDGDVIPKAGDPPVSDDTLNLVNLTRLHRHATLAKALQLSVRDYLTALKLADDPFASPAATVQFVEQVQAIQGSGFSCAELDYLARHACTEAARVAPADDQVAIVLDSLRGELQRIGVENTFIEDVDAPGGPSVDLEGNLTRQKLALLGWTSTLIDQVVATFNDAEAYRTSLTVLPAAIRDLAQLNDTGTYEVALPAVPAGFEFPVGMSDVITYDAAAQKLRVSRRLTRTERTALLTASSDSGFQNAVQALFQRQDEVQGQIAYDEERLELLFLGAMTEVRKAYLLNASTDVAFQAAVTDLFDAPRRFVQRHMRRYTVEHFAAPLATLPAITSPTALKERIYFDAEVGYLYFIGAMTEVERDGLLTLSTDAAYQTAINRLYAAPDTPPTTDVFLTSGGVGSDTAVLFDAVTTPADRFAHVLRKLLPQLRGILGERRVIQTLGEALDLETQTAGDLQTQWLDRPGRAGQKLLSVFLDPIFVESNPNVAITRQVFADQFDAYLLLDKIALIVKRLACTPIQVRWIFEYSGRAGWPDLGRLPVTLRADPAFSLADWLRLVDFFFLRDNLPRGELGLDDLLTQAASIATGELAEAKNNAKERYLTALADWTTWSLTDVETLLGDRSDHSATGQLRFVFPDDYVGERVLKRLYWCLGLVRRLGASAALCGQIVNSEVDQDTARAIKQTVRAKYDEDQWLTVAKSLRDPLRQQQRDALLAYTLMHPKRPYYWRNVNDIYAYFLIDVEMTPSVMTSRIKQAISSVQLFVQRCQMNLEAEVLAIPEIDEKWWDWAWMKQYRVWEVNRKIFLYPENWIETELLESKTPLFEEVESALLQGDVNHESVEAALRTYLAKLDTIARLEVVGMWYEESNQDLHVFGRVPGSPQLFYRYRCNDRYWTPWEQVDVDGDPDFLIPVVWRHRPYLIWPVFTEEAEPLIMFSETDKRWCLQLTWSEYKEGKWQPKKMTKEALRLGISPYHFPKEEFSFTATREEDNVKTLCHRYDPQDLTQRVDRARFVLESPNGEFWAEEDLACRTVALPPNLRPIQMVLLNEESSLTLRSHKVGSFMLDSTEWVYAQALRTNSYQAKLLSHPCTSGRLYQRPWFFNDGRRTYFVTPLESSAFYGVENGEDYGHQINYRFNTFFHPYVSDFLNTLGRNGVKGLMQRSVQMLSDEEENTFESVYDPVTNGPAPMWLRYVYPPPVEDVDFRSDGAYAQYNWELFFHVPLLMAERLSQNQRFEEAQRWFHYIFDPTDTSSLSVPQRYWITRPFHERAREDYARQRIGYLLQLLATGGDLDGLPGVEALSEGEKQKLQDEYEDLVNAVEAWRADPFKPHLVARTRTAAYQKAVVMKYIDNLIAWGDQLFRRETIEAINEASQLYILAASILGSRPERVPPRTGATTYTYNTLSPLLGSFSNALVEIESFVSPSAASGDSLPDAPPLPATALMLFFCVPKNEKLLGYWDTIADRLFRIRHSMTIEGVTRQLPLFAPPIDPALLVKAAAAGVDIGSVLSEVNVALPYYRFNVMAQKATELCNELKSLGSALLSALEKRDAEELAVIRSVHENNLHQLVEQVRQKQLHEAGQNLAALRASRQITGARWMHYQKLLGAQGVRLPAEGDAIPEHLTMAHALMRDEKGARMLVQEQFELSQMKTAQDYQLVASILDTIVSVLGLTPEGKISPLGIGIEFGGRELCTAMSAFSSAFRAVANEHSARANQAARLAGHIMRAHDWALQSNLAAKELMHIDQQILAAQIRKEIAQKELDNQRTQIEQSQQVLDYMHGKYTNQQLYQWMIGEVSRIYFQAYQLAYDVAKRAEQCFCHELGLQSANFIQFGYWDSLRKGLMSGERLMHAIKRMEVAYLDQNRREYEITKPISIARLDPEAFLQLKQTGSCCVKIPEALFDMDYPGHYMRRIKSVGVSIPCVTGPLTNVNCTLTLVRSSVRHSSNLHGGRYIRDTDNQDPRFTDCIGAVESIVTSSGQNDSGLFEPNLRDERYLPFEGAGAISEWRIELPNEFRQFDYDSISDIILHVRYKARPGGGLLEQQAVNELQAAISLIELASAESGLGRIFSVRREFPTQWHGFGHPVGGGDNLMTLPIGPDRFPCVFQNRDIGITRVAVFVKVAEEFTNTYTTNTLKLSLAKGETASDNPLSLSKQYGLLHATQSYDPAGDPGEWTLRAWLLDNSGVELSINPDALEDLVLVCNYTI